MSFAMLAEHLCEAREANAILDSFASESWALGGWYAWGAFGRFARTSCFTLAR